MKGSRRKEGEAKEDKGRRPRTQRNAMSWTKVKERKGEGSKKEGDAKKRARKTAS